MKHKQAEPANKVKPNTLERLKRQWSVDDAVAKFLFPHLFKKYGKNGKAAQQPAPYSGLPERASKAQPTPFVQPKPDSRIVFRKYETELESIFLTADTHFDEGRVVPFRPFENKHHMNQELLANWNAAVPLESIVFMVGDFGSQRWGERLNGEIILISGNHDIVSPAVYALPVEFGGRQFVLSHYPYRNKLPFPWDGWIIHGHLHNHHLDTHPFIDGIQKTVNVSVDVTGYAPISVQYLLSLDLDSVYFMKNIDSSPSRW